MRIAFIGLLTVLGYLLFWPVAMDPVAWEAPEDQGYVDDFAPNSRLAYRVSSVSWR